MNYLSVNFISDKEQRKNKIVYIFWNDYFLNRKKYKHNFEYANDLMHMTSMISNSKLYHNYDRISCHNLEQALELAHSAGFYHAFVQTPGNIVDKNIDSLLTDFVKNNDYFLAGHILDGKSKSKYLWMHEQCFLFNLTHLENFDYTIDNRCIETKEFQDYERSVENFHDNYTPLWVKGKETKVKSAVYDWTAPWLDYGLKINLLKIFPEHIRKNKFHMYPENQGHFETWKGLSTEDNQLQRILNKAPTVDNQQHIFNNENFGFNEAYTVKDKIHTLVVPASGFFSVHAAKFFNPKKIIFYDIDSSTLNFRKKINDTWDAKSPIQELVIDGLTPFLDIGVKQIQLIDGQWIKTQEEVDAFWPVYQNIEKEYRQIDIIGEVDKLINAIPDTENVYVWLNSIYTYSINIWNHRPNKIFKSYFDLIYSLQQSKNRIWIDCKEPTGQYRCFEVHDYLPDAVLFGNANYRKYM